MEDIYTIKVRTNPDPRELYPSERRYSASTVLGLGVVHIALAITVLLLASLSLSAQGIIFKADVNKDFEISNQYENFTDFGNATKSNVTLTEETDFRNDDMAFLDEDVDVAESTSKTDDVIKNTIPLENSFHFEDIYSPFVSLTVAPCLMSLGALSAGLTGLLAWKRWYIDQNIRWFFFMSSFATLTSFACLTVTGITVGVARTNQNYGLTYSNGLQNENTFIFSFTNNNVYFDRPQQQSVAENENIPSIFTNNQAYAEAPNIRLVLALNLLIASVLEFIWSILSTKIAWTGMRNGYPDDIILSRGKIEVNTVHKGNKKCKPIAPDILNHHPKKRKFAKYFPQKETDYLPKAETNIEYQERVNKFLSSNISDIDS